VHFVDKVTGKGSKELEPSIDSHWDTVTNTIQHMPHTYMYRFVHKVLHLVPLNLVASNGLLQRCVFEDKCRGLGLSVILGNAGTDNGQNWQFGAIFHKIWMDNVHQITENTSSTRTMLQLGLQCEKFL